MTIPMKDFMDKVPGGVIIVPLLIGCALNTFCPEVLMIGSFTTGIATGSAALMGALFLCLGAQLDIRCAPQAVKTGAALVIAKLAVATLIGWGIGHFFNDNLFGLSMLAVIAAVSNSNGALYATMTATYGTKSDRGAMALVSLNDGPFLTMMVMGASGSADIPYISLIAALIPLFIGVVIGNLDPKMRKVFMEGTTMIILLVAFSVGCTMHFQQILSGGISGILLGLCAIAIGGIVCIIVDRMTGGSGVAGAAISSVAANAVATPAAVAAVDSKFLPIVGVATAQIAAASIVTCLLTPFLVAWVAKKKG
ncbi:MAG: 2-keto-3-deoxygluconate permease [Eubacterium sp.]|nr:2-keto-3-deoxygluconate permease [Eubacterium sp.]